MTAGAIWRRHEEDEFPAGAPGPAAGGPAAGGAPHLHLGPVEAGGQTEPPGRSAAAAGRRVREQGTAAAPAPRLTDRDFIV